MYDGFLGTPASIMLDVVVVSLLAVVPTLLFSIYLVKFKRNYALHKLVQISLGAVLLVVVLLFEIDMRMQGGFKELAKDSPYIDTTLMWTILYVHLFFSITTVIIWAVTLVTAMREFPNPVGPGVFSPTHKKLAWVSVIDMVATVVTGLMVYYFGFMAT